MHVCTLLIVVVIEESPGIASIMILSRFIHVIGSGFIIFILFGPLPYVQRLPEARFEGFLRLRKLIDDRYTQDNVYLVEITSFLSFCELTMLQFLPWIKSSYYIASVGYPNHTLMTFSLTLKTVETTIYTICEIVYLSTQSNSTSKLAKALFIVNICVGIGTVLMELLVLCLRRGILTDSERKDGDNSEFYKEDSPDHNEEESPAHNEAGLDVEGFETASVYARRDSSVQFTCNPLANLEQPRGEETLSIEKDGATTSNAVVEESSCSIDSS